MIYQIKYCLTNPEDALKYCPGTGQYIWTNYCPTLNEAYRVRNEAELRHQPYTFWVEEQL